MQRCLAHALTLTVLIASGIIASHVSITRFVPASLVEASRVDVVRPVDETSVSTETSPVNEPTATTAPAFSASVERWRGLSLATSRVVRGATGVNLEDDLLLALVAVESNGDPGAHSGKGAMGLTQVEPATFRDLQTRYRDILGGGSLQEPRTNLLAGAVYLAECARLLHADLADPSDLELVLKAYNLGPRAAAEWRATGTWLREGEIEYALPAETLEHTARIVAAYESARDQSNRSARRS